MRAIWIAALATLLAGGSAAAATTRRCSGGRFLVANALLGGGYRAGTTDAVVVEAGRVSIASGCPSARVRMKASRKGTTLKAVWGECGEIRGVRLRARIDRACLRMAGVLAAGTPEVRQRFTATRVPTCGNGVREADEQCDDGNTAPGDCCSATCRNEDGGACVTTACRGNADCPDAGYCERQAGTCDSEGVCRQRPEACIGLLEPVCACDGRSYVNACEAARAGVGVRSRGRCRERCGGIAGIPCSEDRFCEFAPGECQGADLEGTCVAVAEACLQIDDPVCGGNGQTYGNDCARRGARVQKAHEGACACRPILCAPGAVPRDTDGDGCPDRCITAAGCASNDECEPDAYCAAEPGRCDARGLCTKRPEACPPIWEPVCGCDRVTYGSACAAAGAGVRVAARGACTCPVILCQPGTQPVDRDGDGCVESCLPACREACDCYRTPDVKFPTPCPLACASCGNFWVCEEGVCRDRCGPVPPGQGQCPAPATCGTIVGIPCPERQYCELPPAMCDAADLSGRCVEVPGACPQVYSPVCGCDAKTYGNDCERRGAQVQKAHDGPCGRPCPNGTFTCWSP